MITLSRGVVQEQSPLFGGMVEGGHCGREELCICPSVSIAKSPNSCTPDSWQHVEIILRCLLALPLSFGWLWTAVSLALNEMRLCGYKVLLFAWRPPYLTRTMYVERSISLLTYVGHLLCQLIEPRDLSENSVDEVRDVKS